MQVVHHPTVIAAHAWGRDWQFAGDVDLRSKFWGRSIELQPVGTLMLNFADGDQYSWHKVSHPGPHAAGGGSCKVLAHEQAKLQL